MAGYAPAPYVQQHLLDAVGRWAARATGLKAYHGEQNATHPATPYIALEWLTRPNPTSPRVERLLASMPTSGLLTVTADPDGYVAVVVNLVRPVLTRGALETLPEVTDRLAAELAGPLAGRVVVERVDDDKITLTPAAVGDLWRVTEVVGVTAATVGEGSALVIERIYQGELRVWVIGGAPTSGEAGTAGESVGTGELAALLVEALVEGWCRELFDQYAVRCATPEPEITVARGRRGSATREDRAYIDIEFSIAARFAVPPKPVTMVGFGVALDLEPPIEAGTVEVEVEVDAES